MKIVIIGATGATGKALVSQALNEDKISEVTALVVRNKLSRHPKLTQIIVDFLDPKSYSKYLEEVDIAFSCMGTTLKAAGSKEAQWIVDHDYQLNFAKIAKQNKVPQFVLLSAMNANPQAKSFYGKMKGQLEEAIKQIEFDRLAIIKPSLLIRPSSDRTLENIGVHAIQCLDKLGFLRQYRPLHVDTVAKAMIRCALGSPKPFVEFGVNDILKITE